jgi:hypothetical protein
MSRAFRRVRGGRYAGAFHPAEADLLRSLVTQLLDLLDDRAADGGDAPVDPLAAAVGIDASAERPRDPVLLRLFPDAYPEDAGAAEDFRRFTERGLREGKVTSARAVLASLDAGTADRPDRLDLSLDGDGARAWLRTLTDLRLALGTRLGVEQDDEARWAALPPDDPLAYVHDVYEWLGWLQETLVRALSKR